MFHSITFQLVATAVAFPTVKQILIAVVLGLLIGWITAGVMKGKLKSVEAQQNAASYLKKGGILVYSTCTLGRAENQEIATRFVAEHPEFAPESFTVGNHTAQGGMLMLTPHRDGTDGFFIFRLRRL